MKCFDCGEPITGCGVVYIETPQWKTFCKRIYKHPECFHKKNVRFIKVHDFDGSVREYELHKSSSIYFWLGDI